MQRGAYVLCILQTLLPVLSFVPQANAAYESHSEQFSCIVPQLHCSVHYEYTATSDNASAASQSPARDTSSMNQYS